LFSQLNQGIFRLRACPNDSTISGDITGSTLAARKKLIFMGFPALLTRKDELFKSD